jgi:hypothetical protein
LLQRLEKIASLQLLPLLLPPFAMQQVNLHSCTAVKEISVSVLQSPNAYPDFAILYLSVHHSQCRPDLPHKF